MSDETPFKFEWPDEKPTEFQVKIGKNKYLVKSPTAKAATAYKNGMAQVYGVMFMAKEKGNSFQINQNFGTDTIRLKLLADCVFPYERTADGKSQTDVVALAPMPLQHVEGWKSEITEKLIDEILKLGKLDEKPVTVESLKIERAQLDEKIKLLEEFEAEREKTLRGITDGSASPNDSADSTGGTSPKS